MVRREEARFRKRSVRKGGKRHKNLMTRQGKILKEEQQKIKTDLKTILKIRGEGET